MPSLRTLPINYESIPTLPETPLSDNSSLVNSLLQFLKISNHYPKL